MTKLNITDGKLLISMLGADKFWALKSEIIIPLGDIINVSVEPAKFSKSWWQVLKAPGTCWPGLITAGTYYYDHKKVFWNVRRAKQVLVIRLEHEDYNEIVLEMPDPEVSADELRQAISG